MNALFKYKFSNIYFLILRKTVLILILYSQPLTPTRILILVAKLSYYTVTFSDPMCLCHYLLHFGDHQYFPAVMKRASVCLLCISKCFIHVAWLSQFLYHSRLNSVFQFFTLHLLGYSRISALFPKHIRSIMIKVSQMLSFLNRPYYFF